MAKSKAEHVEPKTEHVEHVGHVEHVEHAQHNAEPTTEPVKKGRKAKADLTDYTVVIKFPLELRRDIKVSAIMENMSVNDFVAFAVGQYLSENPAPVGKSK